MNTFLKIFIIALTIFGCLALSGIIQFGDYTPPMGKLLFPKTGLWQNADVFIPDFKLEDPALKDAVEIIYDDRGVPHIYANNLQDALLAQGYVEARDRLFQMDITSRSASGRLSEILGKKFVDADERTINAGMTYAAENAVSSWKKSPRFGQLETYVKGVNLFIDQLKEKQFPFEFKLLDYEPQTWTIENCSHIQKSMARVLCYGSNDIAYSNLYTVLGDSLFNKLYPERNAQDLPIIPKGTAFNEPVELDSFNFQLNAIDTFTYHERIKTNDGAGSNNWAVNAVKTKNGHPILSNDPHLNLTYPSVWYEIHIVTPDFNARGVTIAGMPGIMIGFNEHIAWGETNVGQDVKDFYRIKYTDQSRTKYIIDDQVLDIDIKSDTIKVRGSKDKILNTHYTKWGPIVYFSEDGDKDLALHWLAHEGINAEEAFTFVDALSSKNYSEYRKATSNFITPAQNFLVASKDDDIGIEINGLFPAKQEGDGKFIKDGSNSISGWERFIPEEQKAEAKNPPSGYVASANQWSTAEDYPYYYTGRSFENYRGRIINRYLASNSDLTVEDMKAFQLDNYNIKAEELTPFLLKSLEGVSLNDQQNELKSELEKWNFKYNPKDKAPIIFEKWFRTYRSMIIKNHADISERMFTKQPAAFVVSQLSLDNPTDFVFDDPKTDQKETAFDLSKQAFIELIPENLKENWGKENALRIGHIARIPGLGSDAMYLGGNGNVLNAINGSFGPSWRMIVELGDTINAIGVFPGGQSGNPPSKYYDNNTKYWANGEYHTLTLIGKDSVIQNKSLSITLNPKHE